MKKVFFFAAAAMAIRAGCQKNEMGNGSVNEGPVAIALKSASPALTVTRAAVEAWADTDVNVYGLKTNETGTSVVINNQAVKVAADGSIDLKNAADPRVPYYYEEGATYDFYGYYMGAATSTAATATAESVVYNVEFDGSVDLMYAKADKAKDIEAAKANNPALTDITVDDVYSAWSARATRGVQPKLVFKHALSRFNFHIVGIDAAAEDVRIDKIVLKSVNKGQLTVVGETLGFVADATAEPAALSLKKVIDGVETELTWDPATMTGTGLDYAVTVDAADDSLTTCLMVAPNMSSVEMVVYRSKKETVGEDVFYTALEPYTYTVQASSVKTTDNTVLTEFKEGYAYSIKVNVFGPQKITISAELTDWVYGGSVDLGGDDSDRPEPKGVTATFVEVKDGKACFTLRMADNVTAYSYQLSESAAATGAAWQYRPVTRAYTTTLETTVPDLTKTYYLHVRYTTDAIAEGTELSSLNYVTVAAKVAVPATQEPETEDEPVQNTPME